MIELYLYFVLIIVGILRSCARHESGCHIMKNTWKSIEFVADGMKVVAKGCPDLEDCTGLLDNDGMAFFFGRGKDFYVANTKKGLVRKLSSGEGTLMVEDSEVDYDAIVKGCPNGYHNALNKTIRYAGLNRYDGFKDGLCAISWMLYPEGGYFADGDGFGMKDNDEEEVYAIMDKALEIIEPFRPVWNIYAYLKKIRAGIMK